MSFAARALAVAVAAAALVGCATTPPRALAVLGLEQLPGWADEDHAAALSLVRADCADQPQDRRPAACAEALSRPMRGDAAARAFLDRRFRAEPVDGAGLLTAYYSPTYEARHAPAGDFTAPVRPPSAGAAAATRAQIDGEPASDALAWMRPEDLFFLQIQGSGALTFADGTMARAVVAGTNGADFVPIARILAAQGRIPASRASASAVHAWLAAHRGPQAEAAMELDPRYVFFRLEPYDGAEPRGSSGARLIPGRSVAVDPAWTPAFRLLWIDARSPVLDGAKPVYQRLVAALDSGGAIKGPVRADLYIGQGPSAALEAGRVRHDLRLFRILPAP